MDKEFIYIVTEEWDKEELEWWLDNGNCDLICKPYKRFQTGIIEERFAAAVRYFEERLNYIYIRRHMYPYLKNVPFCVSLLKAEIIEGGIDNKFLITSVDQNSPLPKDFTNGLYSVLKRPLFKTLQK